MSLSWEESTLVLVRVGLLVVARHYLYRVAPELLSGTFLVTGPREGWKDKYLVLVHVGAQSIDIRLHNVDRPVVPTSLRQGVSSWRGVRAPSTTVLFPPPASCPTSLWPQRRCIERAVLAPDPVVSNYLQDGDLASRTATTSTTSTTTGCRGFRAINLEDCGSRPLPTSEIESDRRVLQDSEVASSADAECRGAGDVGSRIVGSRLAFDSYKMATTTTAISGRKEDFETLQLVAGRTRDAERPEKSRLARGKCPRLTVPTAFRRGTTRADPPLSRRVPRWRRTCVRRVRPSVECRLSTVEAVEWRTGTVEERNPLAWLSRSGDLSLPLFLDVHPLGIGVSEYYGDLWRVHPQSVPDDRRRSVSIRAR